MRKSFGFTVFVLAMVMAFTGSAFAQNKKSDICHKSGSTYSLLNVNNNAIPGHTSHGDALPGTAVPDMTGYEFTETCEIIMTPILDFFPFYIRNSNSTTNRTSPPWDTNMMVAENAAGNGFYAQTPSGGQKVGYGTSYYDGVKVNQVNSATWTKVSGADGYYAYMNMWVTNTSTYAVIASEDNYLGQDFATRQAWKVFEYDTSISLDWLCKVGPGGRDASQYLTCNGVRATLADIPDNVVLRSPSGTYPSYVGTGAPRGGYSMNFIWGDTAGNFPGQYEIAGLSLTVEGITKTPTTQDTPTNP